jgi:ABC-type phosphate transport system substrate-binding protein
MRIFMEFKRNKIRINSKLVSVLLATTVISILLNGCSADAQGSKIKVSAPGDLYYLGAVISAEYATEAGVLPIQVDFSENTINDLKQGKTDAVLLGREPTIDELKGLKEYVIAYDAVCIILDQNSYLGGNYLGNGYPTVKTDGIKNLTTQDLTQIFSTPTGTAWPWNGEYYIRDPLLDPKSWIYTRPDLAWIKQPANVSHSFNFPVGEFDTQSVIYEDLGLDEKSEVTHNGPYSDPKFHLEQEIISFEYNGINYSANSNGRQNFDFKLGFASRAVMTIAPQHVPVDVVSVDDINPMENPQSIYDGSYKFTRKIYLLTSDNSSDSVEKLAEYLQAESGQKLITNAGYLSIIESH